MVEPLPILPSAPETRAPTDAPLLRACLFRLGGSACAVDVRNAREVAVFDDITRVPRAPAQLLGVANLRGTVMPIVDIRGLLGLAAERLGRGGLRTLVVHDGESQVAVAVDTVLGLEPFDEVLPAGGEPGGPVAGDPQRAFVAGRLRWGAEAVALLDVGKIIGALRAGLGGAVPAGERPAAAPGA